jgi:iron complex outermembrane receptor protein
LITKFRGRAATRVALGVSGQALAAALALSALAAPAYAQDTPAEEEQGEEIIVTGFAASLESAVAEKKNRDQVVESISAEDIGKLPDASIAESIARLPGLTSQRLSGRSNSISIRGFSPDFSSTLLNGREQTSTGDNRAVEYDQYPSEIINQVLVYKTPMASLIGQGLSGTVDLRTIRPLEYGKSVLSVGARGSYADIGKLNAGSKDKGYRLNATYVGQFANDTIGVALAASYVDEPYHISEFNSWGYPTVDVNDGRFGSGGIALPGYAEEIGKAIIGGSKSYNTSTQLTRLGLQGTLELRPVTGLTITFDAFFSDFKDDQIKRGIELPLYWGGVPLNPNTTISGNQITGGTFTNVKGVVRNDVFQREAKLYSFGSNVTYENDDGMRVMFDASYSKTDRHELNLETYAGTGRSGTGATDSIGFTTSETGTTFTHNLNYGDFGLILLTSSQGWGGTQIGVDGTTITGGQDGYYNDRLIDDEIRQFRLELEKDLDTGFLRSIQVGANYTHHTKSLTPVEYFMGLKANTNGTTSVAVPTSARIGTTDLLFGLGPVISYDPLALVDAGLYNLVPNPYGDVVVKSYSVTEELLTPYIQANIKSSVGAGELTGNIGVQAILTNQKSTGATAVFLGTNPNGSPNIGATRRDVSADYIDVLPSGNLSMRFPGDFVIRIAAAREIVRPRLDDMRASVSYGYQITGVAPNQIAFVTGGSGNPDLRPWRANAIDLTFEKYFGTKGYLALQLFHKDLKSYIYNVDVEIPSAGLPLSSPGAGVVILPIARLNVPINGQGGKLYGFEAAGTLPFDSIISALSGFGVTGGASYTKTRISPTPGAPPEDIPGYSKWVINGTAYFEKWGFNARGSVRYRSTFVGEVSGFAQNRVRRRAASEMIFDAQVGYDFQPGSALEGLSFYVQGQNLTNEPFITANPGQPLQVIDYQLYGRRFLAGASFKF